MQVHLERFGGANRNRTDDLLNAIQALSQLSYGPTPGDAGTVSGEEDGANISSAPCLMGGF